MVQRGMFRSRSRRKHRPKFDLQPYAESIQPGTILFLRDDASAQAMLAETDLDRGALGHPCVVVSPPRDSKYARVLLLTSWGGKLIQDHIKKEYWQDYLPISPTRSHPVYPGIQLHIQGAPNATGGYVNIIERHMVPWAMLTKWVTDAPPDQVHFDLASMELIFYFMESATYDASVEEPVRFYSTLPTGSESYRERLVNTRSWRRELEIPSTLYERHARMPFNVDDSTNIEPMGGLSTSINSRRTASMEHRYRFHNRLNQALLSVIVAILVIIFLPVLKKALAV